MTTELKRFTDLEKAEYWDVAGMSKAELDAAFEALNGQMNTVYRFVLGYNDYINMGHSYDSDLSLTMLEVHTLTDICDCPNSTVTSLAQAWSRSVSATSQTVRRLMAKGLVTRENAPNNGKVFYLRPTEKGARVSDQHKRYDVADTIKTVKRLMKTLSFQEIQGMFQSLDAYVELLNGGRREDRREE